MEQDPFDDEYARTHAENPIFGKILVAAAALPLIGILALSLYKLFQS
jgi:hypothetical protein